MTAVFETDELLHHILLHLPVKFRARTRRVSPAWNYVMSKIGYSIDPYFMDNMTRSPFLIYSAYTNIRINPILDDTGYNPGDNRVFLRISCKPPYSSTLPHRQEFIIAPPITKTSFGFDVNDRAAILGVHDDFRVGDLVDLLDKMHIQASLPLSARGQPIAQYHLCEKAGKWWRKMTGQSEPDEHCCAIRAESEEEGQDDYLSEDVNPGSGDDGREDGPSEEHDQEDGTELV